jgi:hypothetical protein
MKRPASGWNEDTKDINNISKKIEYNGLKENIWRFMSEALHLGHFSLLDVISIFW